MSTQQSATPPMSLRGHSRALMALALPLAGSHLAQFSIQIADTVMIGWYSVEALAGLVLAGTFFFVFFLVGSGFGWAVMPMVASAAGTDDDRQVRRVTRMAMWLSIAFGAVAMVPMFFAEPIFLAIGQDPVVAHQGALYLKIAAWGMIPAILIMVLKSYLAALEHTRVVLVATIVSAILNALLNYALIFGNWGAPELGIQGAALASVVIQCFGVIWFAVYAITKTPQYELFRNFTRPDNEALKKVFSLGWPIGLTSLAEVGLFSLTSVMLGWIGVVALAAHGVALQIISVIFMVHIGLSNAVTVRVGKAAGQGDMQHLRAGAGVGLLISGAIAFVTMIVFLVAPNFLLGLYVDPTDPAAGAIFAIGAGLLAVAAVFQIVDAAQVMTLGMLRGMQDTRVPMLIAGVTYWLIGAPACYLLGFTFGYGAQGVWFGLLIGLGLAAVVFSYRFWWQLTRAEPVGARAA